MRKFILFLFLVSSLLSCSSNELEQELVDESHPKQFVHAWDQVTFDQARSSLSSCRFSEGDFQSAWTEYQKGDFNLSLILSACAFNQEEKDRSENALLYLASRLLLIPETEHGDRLLLDFFRRHDLDSASAFGPDSDFGQIVSQWKTDFHFSVKATPFYSALGLSDYYYLIYTYDQSGVSPSQLFDWVKDIFDEHYADFFVALRFASFDPNLSESFQFIPALDKLWKVDQKDFSRWHARLGLVYLGLNYFSHYHLGLSTFDIRSKDEALEDLFLKQPVALSLKQVESKSALQLIPLVESVLSAWEHHIELNIDDETKRKNLRRLIWGLHSSLERNRLEAVWDFGDKTLKINLYQFLYRLPSTDVLDEALVTKDGDSSIHWNQAAVYQLGKQFYGLYFEVAGMSWSDLHAELFK